MSPVVHSPQGPVLLCLTNCPLKQNVKVNIRMLVHVGQSCESAANCTSHVIMQVAAT